jgi:hypothetical protein
MATPLPWCRSEWSGRAVVVPGLAAGVLFCGFLVMAIQQAFPAEALPVEGDLITAGTVLGGTLAFLVLASVIGLVISAIPILIGVTVLAAIGRWNLGTRHSAFWALAGAALPASAAVAVGSNFADPTPFALMMTGAACAAIARRYVRWSPIEE